MLNLYSLGHLIQWFIIGRFFLKSWVIFFALSIGWELLELVLPYEFAVETYLNKFTDIIVNSVGFYVGNYLRKGVFDKEQE
jgi:hypothetical protein